MNELTHALTLSSDGKKIISYNAKKNKFKDILFIPDGVEEIGYNVFSKFNFNELYINKELKSLGKGTLLDEQGFIKTSISKIVIPSDNYVYTQDNYGLYETLGNGKKKMLICNRDVAGDVVLDNCVESIENGAFSLCKNIKSLTLHDNIKSLGSDPNNFENINIIVSESNEHLFIDEDSLYEVLPDNSYKLISCRYKGKGRPLILEGTSIIGDYAFKNCKEFKLSEIPSSITELGFGIFGYREIDENKIPDTVKRIGLRPYI